MAHTGLHFFRVSDGPPRQGRRTFPHKVVSLTTLKAGDEVMEERRDRRRGEPVPRTLRQDRDCYDDPPAPAERWLPLCAGAGQIENQFHDVVDDFALAKKRLELGSRRRPMVYPFQTEAHQGRFVRRGAHDRVAFREPAVKGFPCGCAAAKGVQRCPRSKQTRSRSQI